MALADSTPILVVDDEWMMVEIITSILHRLGYMDVDYAHEGASALTKMWSKAYGLIISDLNMEPMGGLELLRAVRGDRLLKNMPFIMTTASMNTKNVFEAKLAGVDCYLLKPFSPNILANKLAAMRSPPLPDIIQRDIKIDITGPVDDLLPALSPVRSRGSKGAKPGSVQP